MMEEGIVDQITLDTTITLGVIVHLAGMVTLIVGLYYKLVTRIESHEKRHERVEQKVEMIWGWFKHEHGLNGAKDET